MFFLLCFPLIGWFSAVILGAFQIFGAKSVQR
jgi:hypothetical protein